MDGYELGHLVGKITIVLFVMGVIWIWYRLFKALFEWISDNPTKKALKTYLFWQEFSQRIDSTEKFIKELGKIKNRKVYIDDWDQFYLTLGEAKAKGENVKPISIKQIINSNIHRVFLMERLEYLTLYEKKDLKNIPRNSKLIWTNIFNIDMPMVLHNKKIIYPGGFPVDNQFRFGYQVFTDERGKKGIYDIDADELIVDFDYKSVECFSNIAELSKDEKTYELYDLKTMQHLQTNDIRIFPNLPAEIKERIDVSKMELEDYLFFQATPKTRSDLEDLNLWGAKVGVHKVPSEFEEILEDPQSGRVEWNHYCSADIFDMSLELPINFKKKNGEYVSLGIRHEFLVLEKEYRQRLTKISDKCLYEVCLDDNEDSMGKSRYVDGADDLSYTLEKFNTKEEAFGYIEEKIDTVLEKMAKSAKTVDELKNMDISENVSYFIKVDNKEKIYFETWNYIQENAKRIFDKLENKTTSNIKSFSDLLKRGNLPDDDRVVPNYLKIKNGQYDDVDFSNNSVDEVIKLTSEEFNELISQSDNGLLFTWLSTLSKEEFEKFYKYNDEVVKLANNSELTAKEQFENAMESINANEITDTQKARATLEMPLMINYAKELYIKTIAFRMFQTYDLFREYEKDEDIRFEKTLSGTLWDEMKYIPDYFEQVLTLFKDFYDEKSEYHQKIFKHLVSRFGMLIATLNRIVAMTGDKQESLNWFTGEMIRLDIVPPLEISVSQTRKLESEQKLINFLTLMYVGICDENEENYISNLIECVETLFEWYPANDKACEYAMVEMIKSVAVKEVSVKNANRFLEFFEELPRFYKVLSYEKIMELKGHVNHTLHTYKPYENKVFEQEGVKNRLILLNYKIDMEDLYYESGENR